MGDKTATYTDNCSQRIKFQYCREVEISRLKIYKVIIIVIQGGGGGGGGGVDMSIFE